MHIIMGASGHVGSAVIKELQQKKEPFRAIFHSEEKAARSGMNAAVADVHNAASLIEAFKGANSLFIITPETGQEEDVLEAAQRLLSNYKSAVKEAGITSIVAISSMGAQHATGTGNLQVSYMLEHTFSDLPVKQVFIRPAYYFVNWTLYLPMVKESGVLPSFFPADFKLPMVAPEDVGKFAAELLSAPLVNNRIYNIEGPKWYSAGDVAAALSVALNREVKVQVIPREGWGEALKEAKMSDDAVDNFIKMTAAVLDGRTQAEGGAVISIKGNTTLEEYIGEAVSSS
jgi:uncharacterized protein YbjT (DUF2867 family)